MNLMPKVIINIAIEWYSMWWHLEHNASSSDPSHVSAFSFVPEFGIICLSVLQSDFLTWSNGVHYVAFYSSCDKYSRVQIVLGTLTICK